MRKRILRFARSLQFQLFLWAVLPVTLVIIALAFTGVYAHQRSMRDFVADRNLALARLAARVVADGLSYGVVSPVGEELSDWIPPISQEHPPAVGLSVVDGAGEILARSDRHEEPDIDARLGVSEALRQREGFVILPTDTHGPVLVTFAPVEGTDWQVLVQEPVDEFIGPILRLSSLAPAVTLGAAAVSLLILTFGWRTIIRPLETLARAAEQVSWGDFSALAAGEFDHQVIEGVQEVQDLHLALTEMAQRIASYQTGMRDYLTALTEGQEAERARLARELHDGPVQDLIALGHRAEMGQRLVERGRVEEACSLLSELRQAQRETIEELRRIIGAVRPAYLEDLGFLPALEMLVRRAAEQTDAQVRVSKQGPTRRLPPAVELAAYRIAQEALNNAIQHSQADHIDIRVDTPAEGLLLSVTDDGVGFDLPSHPDVLTRSGHFGLMGMRERATLLGGSFHVNTAPGEGTDVTVRIPALPSPTRAVRR